MRKWLLAVSLFLTLGCLRETAIPVEPPVRLDDTGPLVSPVLTNDEYLHGAPRCSEFGQRCWTDAQYLEHIDECDALGGSYAHTCEEDVKSHMLWCLHFRHMYEDACSASRPGDPRGPLAICLQTCRQTVATMEQYNCWNQQISCLSHAGFWGRLCYIACWTPQDEYN